MWKIANLETCRKASNAATESLNIDGRIINNQQHVADVFNPAELAPDLIAPMLALDLMDPLFVFHKLLIRHRIFQLG
jgi:hypothetical protein